MTGSIGELANVAIASGDVEVCGKFHVLEVPRDIKLKEAADEPVRRCHGAWMAERPTEIAGLQGNRPLP
jgi:hypothetical protein